MKWDEINKIDLHMHTVISDGTDTLPEILSKIREGGMDLFSITDHDAILASEMVPPLLQPEDPAYMAGVEFSCKDEEGKYHILGYGYNPETGTIKKITEEGHELRIRKTTARFQFLKEELGISFPEEEVEKVLALNNPGKPHIAKLLVKYGYAADIKDGIVNIINKRQFGSEYIRPETAIRAILSSGGIPVLAHPVYGSGEELILGKDLEKRVLKLMDFGIQGLEAYYSGFTKKLQHEVLKLAEKHNLYVTAGSDYHGTNKLIPLGDTNLSGVKDAVPGLWRFLQDIRSRCISF